MTFILLSYKCVTSGVLQRYIREGGEKVKERENNS